jgi:adenylate cyclase
MGGEAEHPTRERESRHRLRSRAREADANPELVATAKLIRRFLPGDESADENFASTSQVRARLGQALSGLPAEQPSAVRELGFGVLQAWEALSETQRRRRGTAEVAILFTDLVGFSSWALEAGDEAAVKLLAQVGVAEESAISKYDGVVVKRLGDGSMAVFSEPEQAIHAAAGVRESLAEIDFEDYTPELRAGIHLGRPRKVGKDYLGVDVNIAARVVDAAKRGQILISEPVRAQLDPDEFEFRRRKRLKAAGAPEQLVVCAVAPRE